MSGSRICIILPGYNEADNLPPLFDAIGIALESTSRGHTVVLIDDGSTDRTAGITAEFRRTMSLRKGLR